ncbi:ead/Ea22-like family protein [Escherichia coli]|uniref:ead/Ea22-like family protein n=1 Tax=Escherichia coli TaxID=562 RepID=UPI0010AB82DB|nr:ead/Ea22-like family protein [Escherichia coli]EFA5521137.1 ead/Ea22-like family protein [Escherichia coli]EFH6560924.1 ead/Ea22-like family protein [Escherichia coli]EHR0745506.1 ead/Ea22-like family protein [Escherichia coli]EID7138353.1 ead/Ea22-like family protein [Escherichia coli]ELE8819056.1 ead/Ea22-like family protein [Escherichia coli]
MSKIDYQKLREIAEKTKIAGEAPVMPFDQRINALNDFMKHFSPDIALALLDERERNLQYIKSRDQENEDIALTVGKLRVELEAAENNLIDSECHVAELEEALRDKQALLEASEKRIAELELREVVLPQCYSMLHRVDFDEPYHTEMVYRQHQVLEALHNAGINVTEAGKGEAS